MFDFIKRKISSSPEPTPAKKIDPDTDLRPESTIATHQVTPISTSTSPATATSTSPSTATLPATKSSWFTRLKQGLTRSRQQFSAGIAHLLLGKKTLEPGLLDELETLLLSADVGVDTTAALIQTLTDKIQRKQCQDGPALYSALQSLLIENLTPAEKPLTVTTANKPFVILIVGVNGNGKTTTIGKLAHFYQQQGKKVMLAAADTFRAAAIEQLQAWGEHNHIPVIAQQPGADSASVAFDALSSAKAHDIDILLVDTAGRLHTHTNLLEELKKIKRVLAKLDPLTPQETLLVIDAGTGQNALKQVETFHQAITISGLALTKLDGTAKAGIIFAITQQFKLPVRFIGIGEGVDDLRPFQVQPFVEALFSQNPLE